MQKNLLIITFDQARGDWLDPDNNFIDLPAMKLLASKGYYFERCYTRSPQCIPSRLSWLTGKMPSQLGVTKNMACNVKGTIPSIFRKLLKSGWYLKIVGKTHWTAHQKGVDLRENLDLMKDLGFNDVKEVGGPRALQSIHCELTDLWQKENYHNQYIKDMKERYSRGRTVNTWTPKPTCLPNHLYPDIWIANEAIKAIEALPQTQPWVLWVSFVGPHEPFDTPQDWRGIAQTNKIPNRINNTLWIESLDESIELKKNLIKWKKTFTDTQCNAFREDYANNLKLLDDQVMRIINSGINHKTTDIMITSDHGEMLGDYNMLYKSTFLEPAIRVPMILANLKSEPKTGRKLKAVTDTTTVLKHVLREKNKEIREGSDEIDWINKISQKDKTIIEYAEERCFIKGQKKLVTNLSGKILWKSDIQPDGIKETPIEESNLISSNDPEWQTMENWARKNNEKLNEQKNQWAEHIEFL